MKVKLLHIGWKSRVMQKRASLSITISKAVALGCIIVKGDNLFCYLAEDEEKRPLMIAYLDGKPRSSRSRNGK